MNKKNITIISIIVALIIITVIVFVVILGHNKNNNTQIQEQTSESEYAINYNPSINATITQGEVPQAKLMDYLPPITIGTIGEVIETSRSNFYYCS